MTKQEIFNRVWQHFVVDKGAPSCNDQGGCLYRGPGDARCAVGLFLSDETATHYEALPVTGLSNIAARRKAHFSPEEEELLIQHAWLLKALQWAHDEATSDVTQFHKNMEVNLCVVAEDLGLEVPNNEM